MELVKESEREYRGGDSGVKYLFRGPNIDWGVILLLTGQSLGGHYHHQVEETFYILEGQASVDVDGTKHELEAGDAIRLKAPECHDIINKSDQPLKMVFIKSPYLPTDKVTV